MKDQSVFKKYSRLLFERFIFSNALQRRVLSGPFSGMRYVRKSVAIVSGYYPRLLGTYELELAPIIEDIIQESFETIINVGAAEGYYAIGFALRNAKTKIIAFESDVGNYKLLGQMAAMNGVEGRVEINGTCNVSSLSASLPLIHKSLIVMDAEGMEDSLLDPSKIPILIKTHILVELHELRVPGISKIISSRFCNTHVITKIDSRERLISDFPAGVSWRAKFLPRKVVLRSMEEGRGWPMSWYYLKPKDL